MMKLLKAIKKAIDRMFDAYEKSYREALKYGIIPEVLSLKYGLGF